MPLPALIAIGILLAALILLGLRRGGRRDLLRPPPRMGRGAVGPVPRPTSPGGDWPAALPGDLEAEVRALLGQNRKLEAIKIVRAATGMGLGEAKEFVERM